MHNITSAALSGLLVGSVGDAKLQLLVNMELLRSFLPGGDAGLKKYFAQHGSLESIFIAGGMIATFSAAYALIDPSMNLIGLAVYGAGLDVLFRCTHKNIFPSLDDYYKKMNPINSAVWGAIPMMLVGAMYHSPLLS